MGSLDEGVSLALIIVIAIVILQTENTWTNWKTYLYIALMILFCIVNTYYRRKAQEQIMQLY